MVTTEEDFESAGPSGTDISVGNTLATTIFKGGTSPELQSDSAQTPAGGGSTLSMRAKCGSTSGGNFSDAFFPFAAPTSTFDVTVWVRLNSMGGYNYASGNSLAGSLAQNLLIVVANSALTKQAACFVAGSGHIFFMTSNPVSSNGYDWLKADGTLITDKQYSGAGTFLTAGVDHKLRIAGSTAGFDVYVDDVKVNSVTVPVGGIAGDFDGVLIGNARHVDDIWFDDLEYSDVVVPPAGGNPLILVAP